MSEEQIKQYYERIEKLLNGANKETYGFAPEEIRQILRWYEHSQHIIDELEKWLKYQDEHTIQQNNYYRVLNKLQELKGSDK